MSESSFATRLQAAWLRRGPLALALWPVSLVYGALQGIRRIVYRLGWLAQERLPVPTVVVGNYVAGGAGKTPTTLALVAWLRSQGRIPGIISRGFGRHSDDVLLVTAGSAARNVGDEPLLMHLRSRAPVAVGRDRVAAGLALLSEHPEVDVIVADDGLQHLRLHRDLQIVVFDERGAGNGWLLPAGPLREPVPHRVPARTLVIYNAPAPSTSWPGHVACRELGGAVELAAWWRGEPASPDAMAALAGRPVVAAAGIARPGRFFGMLRQAGLAVRELPLPDHHDFATLPWPPDTPDVILTEKDAVKLRPETVGATRVWVAALDFALGAQAEAELHRLLPPRQRP